ncbi:MAG: DsbA family oxidoreductase [Alphaproteobacteria bacterium]|nr:DsbA family oxidoreductase [Alphaproteobacteria bacterium]
MWIDVYSDVICPWCYIGKRRLERALKDRHVPGLKIRWRAFQLNPGMPRQGMDRKAYLAAKFGGPGRAAQIYDTIHRMGENEGIAFAFERIERTPNTVDAHRLIAFMQEETGDADALTEALMTAYFIDGRDIGDHGVLTDIAVSVGAEREAARALLESEDGVDGVEADCQTAMQYGINGVPCFILNGKYALSGAQEPESFFPLFDLIQQEAALESTE